MKLDAHGPPESLSGQGRGGCARLGFISHRRWCGFCGASPACPARLPLSGSSRGCADAKARLMKRRRAEASNRRPTCHWNSRHELANRRHPNLGALAANPHDLIAVNAHPSQRATSCHFGKCRGNKRSAVYDLVRLGPGLLGPGFLHLHRSSHYRLHRRFRVSPESGRLSYRLAAQPSRDRRPNTAFSSMLPPVSIIASVVGPATLPDRPRSDTTEAAMWL